MQEGKKALLRFFAEGFPRRISKKDFQQKETLSNGGSYVKL